MTQKNPTFRQAFGYSNCTADDWPILSLPDGELDRLAVMAIDLTADDQKTLECVKTAAHMLFCLWHEPTPENELERELRKFKPVAIRLRANELGVSERTIRTWLKRWGLFVLAPAFDEQLFQKLGMLQRREPNVSRWMNEYRKRRKTPPRNHLNA